jgi:Xaa-Pro aminopeptidase
MVGDSLVREKLEQVPSILKETGVDLWLLFTRESHTVHDPCLDIVVGANVTWHSAFLLTAAGDRIAIVGSLDLANLKMHGHYPEIIPYVAGISDDLRKTLARLDPRRIAVNFSPDDPMSDGLTHGMYLNLVKTLEGTPYAGRLEPAQPVISALRGRKSASEQQRIRDACEVTVRILEGLTRELRAGLTERQVAAKIVDAMRREGGLEPAWEADQCPAVFTGPDSAGAHAGPTDRRIEPGHIMNVDFGVRKNGYCSDLQRTWYFLRPGEARAPEAVQRGFDTIVEAIRESAKALRPGRAGAEIDDVARGYITSRGYDEYPHGLGHQIGRVAHDGGGGLLPRWERYGNTPFLRVESGQCYTIEPRLTVAGHGVATCEEIVAVTGDGCTFLSRPQDSLYVVGP